MKSQTELFEVEKVFKFRARGTIYNDKIWPELDINSKINIRANYGTNFLCLTRPFKLGLDLSPFAHEIKKLKPI